MPDAQMFLRKESGFGALRESVADSNGRLVMRCRIITAGEGSSAYYPAEVLERDMNVLAPIGTKSYWNHPTWTEEWERPERDARNLAGVQITAPEWSAADTSVYANFEFNEADRTYIEQFGAHLGMSIYAAAEVDFGTLGAYSGDIVSHFLANPFNSVDVVTVAGANGAIVSKVSEGLRQHLPRPNGTSASEATTHPPVKEGSRMTPEEKAELVAMFATAVKEALVASAPVTTSETDDVAAAFEAVAESGLPKESRAVVFEAVKAGKPVQEAIDAQKALVKSIEDSVREALSTTSAPAGRVLGESSAAGHDYKVGGRR